MQKIRIDFDNPGLPQHISAVENDSQSRFFQASLYENGKAYTAPEGAAYSIMYRGFGPQNQGWYDTINDGAGKRAACAVSGNVVTCEIARQALQVPGHATIVLCLTSATGYMLKSWPIMVNVQNDDYDNTAEIEMYFNLSGIAGNYLNQLEKAMANAKKIGKDLAATADQTKQAIDEKAKAALASIPEDYTKLNESVGQLKEDIGDFLSEVTFDRLVGNTYSNLQGIYNTLYKGFANPIKNVSPFNSASVRFRGVKDGVITFSVANRDMTTIYASVPKTFLGNDNFQVVNFEFSKVDVTDETLYIRVHLSNAGNTWFKNFSTGGIRAAKEIPDMYDSGNGEWKSYNNMPFPVDCTLYDTSVSVSGKIKNVVEASHIVRRTNIYVSVDGNDDAGDGSYEKPYATISKANESIVDACNENQYFIIVKPGTYTDLQDMYSTVNPDSMAGVVTKDYVFYESEYPNDPSKVVIEWDGKTGRDSLSYTEVASKMCPFHIFGASAGMHTSIKGFTFKCKNIRYCLHIECNGFGVGFNWTVENCVFNWGGVPDCVDVPYKVACIGTGSGQFEHGIFNNNVIRSTNDGNAYENHNWDWRYPYRPAFIRGAKITLSNNDFGGGNILFRTLYKDSADNFDVVELFNNVNINIVKASFGNNSEKIDWRFSNCLNNIAENDVTQYEF